MGVDLHSLFCESEPIIFIGLIYSVKESINLKVCNFSDCKRTKNEYELVREKRGVLKTNQRDDRIRIERNYYRKTLINIRKRNR